MSEAERLQPAEEACIPEDTKENDLPEIKPVSEPLPMAWHAFLCRFLLWAAAVLHICTSASTVFGVIYFNSIVRSIVYAELPAMLILDWTLSLGLIAAAVMEVLAAIRLGQKRASGVKLLVYSGFLVSGSWLVYGVGRLIFIGLSPLSAPVAAQVLAYGALAVVNTRYYRRRIDALTQD